MDEANFPAPAKGAGEPGDVQGVMRYQPPPTTNSSGLQSSGTEPRSPVLRGSIDTVNPQVPTQIALTDPGWDEPGDVRGVIMYLPPKCRIRGSLRDQVEDIDQGVFGHPVVIKFMRRTEGTESVEVFPITSHGNKGPYKPGKPGVPRSKDCLPIPREPEFQDIDLFLDLASGRAPLDTSSGVRTKDTYTVPYQSLKYWHGTKCISTSPRLQRNSYYKMMSFAHERTKKLKGISAPNWRGDPTAPQPGMDSTLNGIENEVMPEWAEKNEMLGNRREGEPAPECAERNEKSVNWRRRSSTPSRSRMDSIKKTDGLSRRASTPTKLSTPTTPDTLDTASTITTPITPTTPSTLATASSTTTPATPMSLPGADTESPPKTPGSPSPLPSDRTFSVVRSSKRAVDARAALVHRPQKSYGRYVQQTATEEESGQ